MEEWFARSAGHYTAQTAYISDTIDLVFNCKRDLRCLSASGSNAYLCHLSWSLDIDLYIGTSNNNIIFNLGV